VIELAVLLRVSPAEIRRLDDHELATLIAVAEDASGRR